VAGWVVQRQVPRPCRAETSLPQVQPPGPNRAVWPRRERPVPAHRQVDLPETGCQQPQPGRRPGPGARSPGGL